jgi:predicted Rossmann fold nucleotide-binding protein DprA/Smf involved in DNA uptake
MGIKKFFKNAAKWAWKHRDEIAEVAEVAIETASEIHTANPDCNPNIETEDTFYSTLQEENKEIKRSISHIESQLCDLKEYLLEFSLDTQVAFDEIKKENIALKERIKYYILAIASLLIINIVSTVILFLI